MLGEVRRLPFRARITLTSNCRSENQADVRTVSEMTKDTDVGLGSVFEPITAGMNVGSDALACEVSEGTLPSTVEEKTSRFDELLDVFCKSPLQESTSALREEMKQFAEAILQDASMDGERKEAGFARKVLSRENPKSPADVLNSLADQSSLENLSAERNDWFGNAHSFEQSEFVFFHLSVEDYNGTKQACVQFTSMRPLKEGFKKVSGIDLYKRFILPSLEMVVGLARAAISHGIRMRVFYEILASRLWGVSRKMANFVYRFARHGLSKTTVTAEAPEVSKRKVGVSEIKEIARKHKVPWKFWDDLERSFPSEDFLVVWDVPRSQTEGAPLEESVPLLSEGKGDGVMGPESGGRISRRSFGDWSAPAEEVVTDLFFKGGVISELFDGTAMNPHTGRKLRKGALLKNIVNVDKWSNPRRPTTMVQAAVEVGLEYGVGWKAARFVFEDLLSKSSFHATLEEKGRRLRKTSWVGGDRAEWFTHGPLALRSTLVLQDRILSPLGLKAVPVSAYGDLCVVRTLAFQTFMVLGRLPPFTWRLMACLAFSAALVLGDSNFTDHACEHKPSEGSLQKAFAEMCGGDTELMEEHADMSYIIVCGQVIGQEALTLRENLNMGLKSLVVGFFSKHNAEKRDTPFSFEGGVDFSVLHMIPVLTGKPLVLIRTVGDVVEDGELSVRLIFDRDATNDTIAVFDVFDVDEAGERHFCTYGTLEEAQSSLGQNTPFIAFWTGLPGGISHLDPVIPKEQYERLALFL